MVESEESIFLPVAFFDGVRDHHKGVIELLPSHDYITIRQLLIQMVGIFHINLKISLIDAKSMRLAHENRQKVVVTNRSNFFVTAKQKDFFFVVELKKKKNRSKRKKTKPICEFESHFCLYRANSLDGRYVYTNAMPCFPMECFQNGNLKCERCNAEAREGKLSSAFHLCVKDHIRLGYPRIVEPIARPIKSTSNKEFEFYGERSYALF